MDLLCRLSRSEGAFDYMKGLNRPLGRDSEAGNGETVTTEIAVVSEDDSLWAVVDDDTAFVDDCWIRLKKGSGSLSLLELREVVAVSKEELTELAGLGGSVEVGIGVVVGPR